MMYQMLFSGFGGQGIMLMGQLLAQAGLEGGKNVTWYPSYGPEMRGGTAYCSIVIADEPIGSPVVTEPDVVVAMNLPSLHRFEPVLKTGGLLIVNTSLVEESPKRADIRLLPMPMNEMAEEINNPKGLNVIALGIVGGAVQALPEENFIAALDTMLGKKFAKKPGLLELNKKAFKFGYDKAAALRG